MEKRIRPKTSQKMNRLSITILLLFILNSSCKTQKNAIVGFLPQGYVEYEKHFGDLNNDDKEDCVLIIKGTNKENIVVNRFDKKVDRNRRGIIVLLKKGKGYEMAVKNESCFYSENEDGGGYYAPQLFIEITDGKLEVKFKHGKYGFRSYTFKYKNATVDLIGYHSTSSSGPITNSTTTIDFVSKSKLFTKNINEDAEGNDEIFEDTFSDVKIDKPITLSEIIAFEELDMSKY